ncbi:MAG: DEAD/DEAH box helicase [Alphaproteobacteria bacterium]|nr:DEAD/DEAH box helicase [Alphaproteobacteria bacterium]
MSATPLPNGLEGRSNGPATRSSKPRKNDPGAAPALSAGRKAELTRCGMRLFRNRVAKEREYSSRKYQVATAVEAVSLASAGDNSAIELPTGTGKTLIACLASVLWKATYPNSRVLLVVPSRTLVIQHFEVAQWVATEIVVDMLRDEQSGNPGSLRASLLRADLLITTPGLLAGALERRLVDRKYVESIRFVIVDEFDTFVVIEEAEWDTVSRFADHWARLKSQLSDKARYLVKSATLMLGDRRNDSGDRTRTNRRAQAIVETLAPVRIEVPERQYSRVIPYQSVIEVRRYDARIAKLLAGVSTSKGIAHLMLDEIAGPTDYNKVERLAPAICKGVTIRSSRTSGTVREVQTTIITPKVREQYCYITKLKMMPQHIVEDLTLNLGVKIQDCRIKTSRNEIVFLEGATVLDDRRPEGCFEFCPGRKVEALVQTLGEKSKAKLRGVVFCRTIRLLNGLKSQLAGKRMPLFELTGEMSDSMRSLAIREFRNSNGGILLMTRTTGGRGLDLPFGHYGVFYSPKSDPVQMWQEMSRIRSTVSHKKDTFVLCYDKTFESTTLTSALTQMSEQSLRLTHAIVGLKATVQTNAINYRAEM